MKLHSVDLDQLVLKEDRVLVEIKTEEKTRSGLIIPQTADDNEHPAYGIIALVGPGTEDRPVDERTRVGVAVLYGKYAGSDIEFSDGDKKYLIMRDPDIMGYINPKNNG